MASTTATSAPVTHGRDGIPGISQSFSSSSSSSSTTSSSYCNVSRNSSRSLGFGTPKSGMSSGVSTAASSSSTTTLSYDQRKPMSLREFSELNKMSPNAPPPVVLREWSKDEGDDGKDNANLCTPRSTGSTDLLRGWGSGGEDREEIAIPSLQTSRKEPKWVKALFPPADQIYRRKTGNNNAINNKLNIHKLKQQNILRRLRRTNSDGNLTGTNAATATDNLTASEGHSGKKVMMMMKDMSGNPNADGTESKTVVVDEEVAAELLMENDISMRGATDFLQKARRAGVGVVGSAMVGVGLVMIPLPMPFGVVVAGSGLAVLGTEYPEAQELLEGARDKLVNAIEANIIQEDEDDDDADDNGEEKKEHDDDQQQQQDAKKQDNDDDHDDDSYDFVDDPSSMVGTVVSSTSTTPLSMSPAGASGRINKKPCVSKDEKKLETLALSTIDTALAQQQKQLQQQQDPKRVLRTSSSCLSASSERSSLSSSVKERLSSRKPEKSLLLLKDEILLSSNPQEMKEKTSELFSEVSNRFRRKASFVGKQVLPVLKNIGNKNPIPIVTKAATPPKPTATTQTPAPVAAVSVPKPVVAVPEPGDEEEEITTRTESSRPSSPCLASSTFP